MIEAQKVQKAVYDQMPEMIGERLAFFIGLTFQGFKRDQDISKETRFLNLVARRGRE